MIEAKFVKTGLAVAALSSAMLVSAAANAAIAAYSTDFDSAVDLTPWEYYGDNGGLAGGYNGPAPLGPNISDLAVDDGGVNQYMNVYANYANTLVHIDNPGVKENISVYINQAFTGADTASGATWKFEFDYAENPPFPLTGDTTTAAFIRVLDIGFGLIAEQTFDTAAGATAAFQSASLEQTLNPGWTEGYIQFGFTNATDSGEGSGRFYDNVNFSSPAEVPIPAAAWLFGSALMGLVGLSRRRRS